MAVSYDTDEERRLHLSVIHALADRYRLDEATIREIYEAKLEDLMGGARIRTYLSVLTERRVREHLSRRPAPVGAFH